MANSYTERVVLSQQLITCLRELASLAQRSADVFHELGDSVTAIDATLSRLSVRTTELDRKVEEWKTSPNGQVASGLEIVLPRSPPRSPLATISESPSPPQERAKLSLFSPNNRPLQENRRYASVRQFTVPVPVCVPVVSAVQVQEEEQEEVMKRAHNPSAESIFSVSDKSSNCGGSSRRSSWRESFRLPSKRRRRLGANSSIASTPTGRSSDRPRSVDFSNRHTVAFINQSSPTVPITPPELQDSPSESSIALKENELERRQLHLTNGGVRRHHAKSTGEVPDALTSPQPTLDDHVISALVERTLHLSGQLDYGLHRPQSSHFSTTTTTTSSGVCTAGPSERSQSCNGLLEQDEEKLPHSRHQFPSGNLPQQAPVPPPRQGSLLRASSMPMSPDMVVAQDGSLLSSVIDTPKLKRSMSISQRARALFRPASTRRSRSRSKEGHLADSPLDSRESSDSAAYTPNQGGNISRCVSGSTDNVQRRRKSRGRSKSPISWLLSRINPPGQPQNHPPVSNPPQARAVSCVESALTIMPIDTEPPVFDSPAPTKTPTAASSVANLFRRRSRSREKGASPRKAASTVVDGGRLAGHFRTGSRSPGTFHRFRADSDDVEFYVRRHIIDFPSQDADDFHVDFSRLASLRLRREALVSSNNVGIGGPGPEPAVPLAHVRHFMQSGRELMTRRGRHRHSRRQTDRYSADATPSTSGTGSESTPMPSPGIARLQAVRPSSLTFKQQQQPPSAMPTSPRLRAVHTSGVAGVGSLAEQLDKLSSQFCNAVSLRRGYKGSGSRSSSGHWSVSTSSLHPKRSSYMSTAGQPTSPLSAISAALPGPSLPRSVSKDSALDSSSPCERPVSELVNVSSTRSVEVQTDKSAIAATPRAAECPVDAVSLGGPRPFGEDDVFCRSSAETLSSIPPAPPPRSASLKRPSLDCDNALYQARSFSGSGDCFSVTQRSRPTTPGRSADGRQPLPVTMPYRSGTLPRNLKARLKSGTDTLKHLENCYRSPDDLEQTGSGDSDSDSSYTDRRVSSSGSDGPVLDPNIDSPPPQPVEMIEIAPYAVLDINMAQKGQLVAPKAMKVTPPIVDQSGPTLLQHPHQLRSPHLSSNSHLSSFSGDSDTGSSCSGPNPYQHLYSLSTQQQRRGRQERMSAESSVDVGRTKYGKNRRLLPETSG